MIMCPTTRVWRNLRLVYADMPDIYFQVSVPDLGTPSRDFHLLVMGGFFHFFSSLWATKGYTIHILLNKMKIKGQWQSQYWWPLQSQIFVTLSQHATRAMWWSDVTIWDLVTGNGFLEFYSCLWWVTTVWVAERGNTEDELILMYLCWVVVQWAPCG